MGNLTIIFGPMFSGKTTKLVQELTRFIDVTSESHKTKCLLINHTFDDRNLEIGISSHGSSFKGVSDLIEIQRVSDLKQVDASIYDVIGIDETQFFNDLSQIIEWVNNGKVIIASGLITDAFMKPFGELYKMIPIADNVIQCHSICSECIKNHTRIITPDALSAMKAPFTFRMNASYNQIDIGASDKYIPVCRYHYNQLLNKL